jgi:hypothetical protein
MFQDAARSCVCGCSSFGRRVSIQTLNASSWTLQAFAVSRYCLRREDFNGPQRKRIAVTPDREDPAAGRSRREIPARRRHRINGAPHITIESLRGPLEEFGSAHR